MEFCHFECLLKCKQNVILCSSFLHKPVIQQKRVEAMVHRHPGVLLY